MPTNSKSESCCIGKGLHLQAFFMGATKDAQGRLRQDAQALLIGVSHSGKRLGRCANGYCDAEMQPELCRFATVLALLPE